MEVKRKFIKNFFISFVGITAFFGFFFNPCEVFAQGEKSIIRVGISNQSFSSYDHSSVKFSSLDEIQITDLASNSQFKIQPNKIIEVVIEDLYFKVNCEGKTLLEGSQGPIVFAPNEKIAIEELNRKGKPAYYKGMLELVVSRVGYFNIVNVLDLQSYIKGVVPNEMPISFGLEALKAQAVGARNYANRPQNAYKNYDICDSTACQVYYGENSRTETSDKAVDETAGIFALYDDEPILALYHSTAGGITEDWKNVYGNSQDENKPYLSAVVDDKNQKFLESEDDVRAFYSNKALSYDIKSPRYRWQIEWTKPELEEVLNKTLLEQSKRGLVEPKYLGEQKLVNLKDIKVLKRGKSGKALEIQIEFENGKFKVFKELGIRRVLKKNNAMLASANFFVDKEVARQEQSGETQENKKEETHAIFGFERFLAKKSDENCADKFIITGGGFGHGVGMSQYGAGYMAQNGMGFDEILKHYYSGIVLGTMKKEVAYNPYSLKYKTDFYYAPNLGNYELYIENPKKVQDLTFSINSKVYNLDGEKYNSTTLVVDITKYLENGLNSIVFEPLSEKDKTKTIMYQIKVKK